MTAGFRNPTLLVSAIVAAIGVVYWPTARSFVALGQREEGLGVLVIATFVAIAWSQRFRLAALPIRPSPWGFAGLAAAGTAWLVGEIIFMRVLTDAAVLAMVAMTILGVLGTRWFRALAFPLAFLFLAVPVWDPLRPLLAAQTADVSVAALRASGIPIIREGASFSIPSGSWSVADECSGLGHFTVCLVLGVLYAWVMYRSLLKRIVFVGGALVLGVVGNWLRVYLTVVVAHLTDNRLLRDDHYAFGWVLYALMIFLYGYIGHRFRDREAKQPATLANEGPKRSSAVWPASAAAFVLLLAWPLIEHASPLAPLRPSAARQIGLSAQSGWQPSPATLTWQPELVNPSAQRVLAFEKNGRRVYLFVGLYDNQTWSSKLVSSVNQLGSSSTASWTRTELGVAQAQLAGRTVKVNAGVMVGAHGRVVAWQWYWIDGVSTASGLKAKWQQLLSRLQGRGDAGAWVAVYTLTDGSSSDGEAVLDGFLDDMGRALDAAFAQSMSPG